MHRSWQFMKVFSKILRHMSRWERFLIIVLGAILLTSFARLVIRYGADVSRTIGSTVYSEGVAGYPHLLNPVFADFSEVDRDIGMLLFSGLLKYDPTVKNFMPDLAQEIKRSRDNLTYLLTLKPSAQWHDGKPVTADDVVFTFQKVIQDPGFKNPILGSAFRNVVIQKVDEGSVSFTLKQPNSYFPSYLTTGLLPAHLLKEASVAELEKNPFNRRPVGTGPYKIVRSLPLESTDSLLLEKFDSYYNQKPVFDYVRFSFYDSQEELADEKNKFNVIPKITKKALKEKIADERMTLHPYSLTEYTGVFFNLDRPLIAKKKIRQSLMKSVNKPRLASLVGDVRMIDTVRFETKPEEWIHQFDATTAEKNLKDLGYKKGGDGFLKDSKGQTLTITFLTRRFFSNSPLEEKTKATVNFLKSSWENIGIKVNVVREDGANFTELVRKREYDLLLSGHRLGQNSDLFAFWHSSQQGENGLNFSQMKSFRVDSLLEDLRLVFDSKKKQAKLRELELILGDEMAALFLYQPEYALAADNKLMGLSTENYAYASDRFANFGKITLQAAEAGIQ